MSEQENGDAQTQRPTIGEGLLYSWFSFCVLNVCMYRYALLYVCAMYVFMYIIVCVYVCMYLTNQIPTQLGLESKLWVLQIPIDLELLYNNSLQISVHFSLLGLKFCDLTVHAALIVTCSVHRTILSGSK